MIWAFCLGSVMERVADGGAVPEGFGFGFVVVDGVGGGVDVDAG